MEKKEESVIPTTTTTSVEIFKEKVFKTFKDVDAETSLKMGIFFFLVYLYHYAGSLFFVLTLYRVYFTYKTLSGTKLITLPEGKNPKDFILSIPDIEKVMGEVLKRFFAL